MSTYVSLVNYSTTPPPSWVLACSNKNSGFMTRRWHDVLSDGLNSTTYYLEFSDKTFASLTVFKASIFRAGYIGFPTGGVCKGYLGRMHIQAIISSSIPVHVIRLSQSAFVKTVELNYPFTPTYETAIENLEDWSLAKVSKFKRNVTRARKHNLLIDDCTTVDEAKDIYHIYRDTIRRNHGSMRYTEEYFYHLIEKCGSSDEFKILLAYSDNREVIGFIILVREDSTVYYLHGGMMSELGKYGGMSSLFYEGILWAKSINAHCFNMMSSPHGQQSLVRYKEKIGGTTKVHKTYEIDKSVIIGHTFRLMLRLHKRLTRLKAAR